jgi:fibro-slime domain-containing protein
MHAIHRATGISLRRPLPGSTGRRPASEGRGAALAAALVAGLGLLLGGLGACGDGYAPATDDGGTADASGLDAGDASPLTDAALPRCGDGERTSGEACDDGNVSDGDGCAGDCSAVEDDYACPVPGQPCVLVVECGNARIEGDETCDDQNTTAGDGCDADCHVEPGWTCPVVGAACVAAACGDGIVAGLEICDDGNGDDGDGCSSGCTLEAGYHCPTPGSPCEATVCGDQVTEGTEECDDGNAAVGDGCAPDCTREPSCQNGVCVAVCGDGYVWSPEQCDDGNTVSGDGCSAGCTVETGFECVETPTADPPEVVLPLTVRDFVAACGTSARPADYEAGATAPYGHPDFECYLGGHETGMVAPTLGPNGKPQHVANSQTYDQASFDRWYVSNPDYNRTYAQTLTLPSIGNGAYQFSSSAFFPVDGIGFVGETCGGGACEVPLTNGHNFHFTSEIRYWFEYNGTEVLDFTGDDDVWVFINGHLAVDIGGVHGATNGSVDLSDPATASSLGLSLGGIYEAVVFQAERHTTQSNYRLTLTNFNRAPSVCTSECGDGIVSSVEACDDGVNDGSYGGCTPDCRFAPYCGDGVVQPQYGEICDDGLNLGGEAGACAPGCQSQGAVCGDGVVQTSAGEQCDDGNTVPGDGCSPDCTIEIG